MNPELIWTQILEADLVRGRWVICLPAYPLYVSDLNARVLSEGGHVTPLGINTGCMHLQYGVVSGTESCRVLLGRVDVPAQGAIT